MEIFIILALAVVVIALTAMLISARKNSQSANTAVAELRELLDRNAQEQQRLESERLSAIREVNETLASSYSRQHKEQMSLLETKHQEEMKRLREDYDERQKKLQEMLALQFETLSASLLKTATADLKSANNENISGLINPLKESLDEFKRSLSDSFTAQQASSKSLGDWISRLEEANKRISSETETLVSALKGNSKVQGDWGETLLETLLEQAGLKQGVHFLTQVSRGKDGSVIRDEEGRNQRPDVLVNLPANHSLIVDSKVSLTAFVEYHEAEDDEKRKAAGARHVASVKRHIDELASKNYQKQIANSADHVLMFIPNEGAFMLAFSLDPQLWHYASLKGIAITSPTHIYSLMQLIAQIWRDDSKNANAEQIASLGGKLYDRLVNFLEYFKKISDNIETTKKTYNEAYRQLANMRGNAISLADKMKEMGVSSSKELPHEIVEEARISSASSSSFLPAGQGN